MPQIETQVPRTTRRLHRLRTTVTVEAVLVFLQPVSAGSLLSGHYEMLAAHRYGAFLTIATAVVMTALSFGFRDGPRRLRLVCALVVVVEAAQISCGYQRVLLVHIPLGVALAAAIVLLLVWVWRTVPAGCSPSVVDGRWVGHEDGREDRVPEARRNRR